ncbi:MAG: hypothetical protein SGILL_007629 [Bacillariaceae sp.]
MRAAHAALGLGGTSSMEQALYMQIQAEKAREYELQQMLVRERLAQDSQLNVIGDRLQEFPDLQQHYSRLLMGDPGDPRGHDVFGQHPMVVQAQEELRRRQLAAEHAAQYPSRASLSLSGQSGTPPAAAASTQTVPVVDASSFRNIAADSLVGNATRRGEVDKRKFAKPDPDAVASRKRSRSDISESSDLSAPPPEQVSPQKLVKNRAPKNGAKMYKYQMASAKTGTKTGPKSGTKKAKKKQKKKPAPPVGSTSHPSDVASTPHVESAAVGWMRRPVQPSGVTEHEMIARMLAMRSYELAPPPVMRTSGRSSFFSEPWVPQAPMPPRGTLRDLIDAAQTDGKKDEAATTLLNIKANKEVRWLDFDPEVSPRQEEILRLPNFVSILPVLPEEPSLIMPAPSKRKKHSGLLDDDSVQDGPGSAKKAEKQVKTTNGKQKLPQEDLFKDLPYPVDTWWPSSTGIKREKKMMQGTSAEDDAEENSVVLGTETKFRVNLNKVKEQASREVQPGILEKVPHCKIHRMLLQGRKSSAPELVHCWQVTELYPNDLMVCCSQCGTWRHTACGGHHKPFSIREATEHPFVPVCDRCHVEDKILEDHPVARKRLDRQRCEQIRRGLSTSAAIRQAAFLKHSGTCKWPLGSVTANHMTAHTRSVHTRHDKAEKVWADMATKLSKGYAARPQDRIKHRMKELERLLISVDDAGKFI